MYGEGHQGMSAHGRYNVTGRIVSIHNHTSIFIFFVYSVSPGKRKWHFDGNVITCGQLYGVRFPSTSSLKRFVS